MFFITIYRLANDIDFIKYAGLQISCFLLTYIATFNDIQIFTTIAATCASFTLSVAGIILVFYKVKRIKKDLEK